ncbi:MAG: glycine zipper 2TM domain-containing protein [Epsilonproteobacteria bacterium]|nr:glycine zipper 2TM domain-containing protein [Campylobacterota bacterium]
MIKVSLISKPVLYGTFLLMHTLLSAEEIGFVEYVNVVSTEPVYENVISNVPHQECFDKQVPVTYRHQAAQSSHANAGALIGGVTGGLIGKQVSHGDPAAMIGGAVLGTLVGHNAARSEPEDYQTTQYETRRHCTTHYTQRSERRFIGYEHIAYYKGRKIVKYSDEKLSSIPVSVTISY